MALEQNTYTNLVELGGSDYEIVDGQPDIRGWDVKNKAGLKIGEVEELLFDPHTNKVRYIIININNSDINPVATKILIPIGTATLYDHRRIEDNEIVDNRIHDSSVVEESVSESESSLTTEKNYNQNDDGKVVVIPINAEQISQLPVYKKGHIGPEIELAVRQVFGGLDGTKFNEGAIEYKQDEFYNHDHFNEKKIYNSTITSSIRKKM